MCNTSQIDKHRSISGDNEMMQRMIAAQRQSRDHSIGRADGCDRAVRQRTSHDSIIALGIDHALIHSDPGAAVPTRLDSFTKTLDDIGLSRAVLVLQGDKKAARMRSVVAVVPAGPSIDVKNAIGCDYHVTRVTNIVSKHRGAKAGG